MSLSLARCPRCTKRHLADLLCWNGSYPRRVFALVIATYGDVCCHCYQTGADTVEHVRPRSKGGTDELDNLLPAHLSCNLARGTKPMPGYGFREFSRRKSERW